MKGIGRRLVGDPAGEDLRFLSSRLRGAIYVVLNLCDLKEDTSKARINSMMGLFLPKTLFYRTTERIT